jgi:hypothetical protein
LTINFARRIPEAAEREYSREVGVLVRVAGCHRDGDLSREQVAHLPVLLGHAEAPATGATLADAKVLGEQTV